MNYRAHSIALAVFAAALSPAAAQFGAYEVAQEELNTLADQMVIVHLDTTYFTTLENLNDLSSFTSTNTFDFINDEGGALVISPATGRFRNPPRLDLVNRPPGLAWQGPYASYQSSRIDGPDSIYDEGTPLDPWGTPYFFYSPLGLIDPQSEDIELTGYLDDFNQYTIVSYGPDGVMSSDDLTRAVAGFSIAVPAISSVRIFPPAAKSTDYTVQVRGYKFGATQGSGSVAVNGSPAVPTSWSDTRIELLLSAMPSPNATFTVTPDGRAPVEMQGFLVEGTVGVNDWMMY
ncbi:MAG: Type secretion system protein [Candidatus Sumerlaeota bacterium]|nr:Type secretion system protein [Candidatus Sumerlaeota bacterium]